MRRYYAYILTVIAFMAGIKAMAQADISMATHWNNRASYNPAFIARTDYLYLFFNTRHQWMGVKGAPVVYDIQVSEYFHSMRSALGVSLVNDKIGATNALNPMLTYAFRIAKKEGWALSMGLSAGVFVRTIDGSRLESETSNDPSLFNYYKKITRPDLNVGFEFQNTHFIYGLSSTHLFSIGKSDTLFLNTNHRYGYAMYKSDYKKLYSYSIGMQVVNRYNLTIIEGNFLFRIKHQLRLIQGPTLKEPQELLDFGVTCRSSRQVTLLFGLMVSPYFRIGYAYDQSILTKFSQNPTHEIMLEYRIPAKAASTIYRCVDKEFWYR
jgi:type IX secretion system PorP/SprF family membrane protein